MPLVSELQAHQSGKSGVRKLRTPRVIFAECYAAAHHWIQMQSAATAGRRRRCGWVVLPLWPLFWAVAISCLLR